MMKKQGFTLAEVLITLTIIGVIATMTLPALMTNTNEQQYKAGLKKGINTLTEAAQMHEAIEGFNYANLTGANAVATFTTEVDNTKQNTIESLVGMLRERTKVDIAKTMKNIVPEIGGGDTIVTAPRQAIYFNDGSALIFNANAVAPTSGGTTYAPDNIPLGFVAVYDTNGLKGPNQLSNCSGAATGAVDTDAVTATAITALDLSGCEAKKTRVMRDQFQIRLRGAVVEPTGAAATWAFGN